MPEAQLKEIMEVVGQPINLYGFLSSGNSKSEAHRNALDSLEKGKQSVCLHVFMKENVNYLKLDLPEYSPYHSTE